MRLPTIRHVALPLDKRSPHVIAGVKQALKVLARLVTGLVVVGALAAAGGWLAYRTALQRYGSDLPSVADLPEIQRGGPLRIYTADGKLMGQFGTELRKPLRFEQIPDTVWRAFLAAEDSDFFNHGAVDVSGLLRAAFVVLTTGEKKQGGSTITMQLARGQFLSREKTYERKIKEILLARRIEQQFPKTQILTMYLNRVFLGNHAYGVAAAAYVYYGKAVDQLDLGEAATLAGLPKAPSTDNPVASPQRARARRNYVLGRMYALGWITDAAYRRALGQPVITHLHVVQPEVTAGYAAELVRAQLVARYGPEIYTAGDKVVTTLRSGDQEAAVRALRAGLLTYTRRHGYDGPEAHLTPALTQKLGRDPADADVLEALEDYSPIGGLVPAAVVRFDPGALVVRTATDTLTLPAAAFAWAKLSARRPLHPGDIVRVEQGGAGGWQLAEVPQVQGALVALDPVDGAIRAMVGGFDFAANNFNRATQAQRQVGSGFKPYLYAAALAKGYTPASVFLDAPIVTSASGNQESWRPLNDDGTFSGPTRMRYALQHSINLVSIRILRAVGVGAMRAFVAPRFGIPIDRIPQNLTAALGTASLTPLEQARGYAVFANGGFLVNPYLIQSVHARDGQELFQARPVHACGRCVDTSSPVSLDPDAALDVPDKPAALMPATATTLSTDDGGNAPRTLSPVTSYLMNSMLHSVMTAGTGSATRALGRTDLGGKTGTTNDYTDAWFNGFSPSLVSIVWVGFDQPRTLGRREFGAQVALPIWMDFMKQALAGVPDQPPIQPPGIASISIDPTTGDRVVPGSSGSMQELVQSDRVPPLTAGNDAPAVAPTQLLY
ncbi:MAG TPA: PBP1A family penicillin-binding protein [Nevskiaceae bacterium]